MAGCSQLEVGQVQLLEKDQAGLQSASDQKSPPNLAETVERAVESYMETMADEQIQDLYELVLSEVEAPLLEIVMQSTSGNQSKAALILGLNRGTLRRKLKKYGML